MKSLFLNWLIFWNHYLTFYKNMGQKLNFGDWFVQQTEDFILDYTMFMSIAIWGKFIFNTLVLVAFMVMDITSLNSIFSIFLTVLVELTTYLKICYWILKQVFHMSGVLSFVLIPCFGVMYVSRSMKLHLFPWES